MPTFFIYLSLVINFVAMADYAQRWQSTMRLQVLLHGLLCLCLLGALLTRHFTMRIHPVALPTPPDATVMQRQLYAELETIRQQCRDDVRACVQALRHNDLIELEMAGTATERSFAQGVNVVHAIRQLQEPPRIS